MTEQAAEARDHSLFEAELSGTVLNFALLRRLARWIRPYSSAFSASCALVLASSLLAVALPIVLSIVVIDFVFRGTSPEMFRDLGTVDLTVWISQETGLSLLLSACVLYCTLHVAWTLTSHWHRMTLVTCVVNALRDLRRDLFAHLETRPSSFYDKVATGRLMTRVTNDIEALFELLRGLGAVVGELVPFLIAVVIMVNIAWDMSAVLLMCVPLLVLVTIAFRRGTRQLFRTVRQSVSKLNANLQENLTGLQVVQLSHREEHNQRKYEGINRENLVNETRSMRLETTYFAFNDSMASAALGAILWYGGGEVVQQQMSLGEMILFTRFIDMLFHPIVVFGEQLNILFRAMASGERIFQALDWDESTREPDDPVQLPKRVRGELEFRNLTFSYQSGVPVIRDFSLKVAPGETLAVVGATGSGKSTLIKLLGRFYDIRDGQVFLDGIDINRINSRDLRRRIGVVLQDFHIFSGSIYDNIALGDARVSQARAEWSAQIANAHNFICEMPKGYQSSLSERGQNISQGQRQLLAFARVLASDPEILVLDEATANVDTETELLIQDALRKLTEGRTSIIIAHRLQTIQDADRVVVLDRGRVVEAGSQQELLERRGTYFNLHRLQFQETSQMESLT